MEGRGKQWTKRQFKRDRESRISQLNSIIRFNVLANKIQLGTSDLERTDEVRKGGRKKLLREVTVKIGLEKIDIQEEITMEALLDSGVTGLVVSSEFARKQGFRLKKINRPIYVRNVDSSFNKEGQIKNIVEVNIYYQEH